MFGEWAETDCHTWFGNINRVGDRTKDDTSKDFWTFGGTAIGHET
jgi:hypothetical protein